MPYDVNDATPSKLEKMRAKYPWFDHLVAGAMRYQNSKGDFFAAGTTYFSVLALFPLLMVGFATAGFVFTADAGLLTRATDKIHSSVSGKMGDQLVDLMNQAIDQRASIGVIGLVLALYSGLGWMAHLRNALTMMWGPQPPKQSFIATKRSDFIALVSLFVALVISFGLSALAGSGLTRQLLSYLALDNAPGASVIVRVVSIVISLIASTVLFTWVVARLPRIPIPIRNALKAGVFTAVVFEIFKAVATVYLKGVVSGPAGATFGPIIGIMVFAFFVTRFVLFTTAWAATDPINAEFAHSPEPKSVVVSPHLTVNQASPTTTAASFVTGIAVGLGVSALTRKKR